MKNPFDYIFFRIHNSLQEKGNPSPKSDGVILVTLLQLVTVLDTMFLGRLFHSYSFPGLFYWFVPLVTIISSINWLRYKGFFYIPRIEIDQWRKEPRKIEKRNMLIILIYFVGSTLLLLFFLFDPYWIKSQT